MSLQPGFNRGLQVRVGRERNTLGAQHIVLLTRLFGEHLSSDGRKCLLHRVCVLQSGKHACNQQKVKANASNKAIFFSAGKGNGGLCFTIRNEQRMMEWMVVMEGKASVIPKNLYKTYPSTSSNLDLEKWNKDNA